MKSFEEEGRKIIRSSQAKASEEANSIVQEAKNDADKMLAEARAKIASEKALAVAEARSEIALLATDIAGRILKREISLTDNKLIAEDFFHEEQP
jgi:F-type H+-transporting ATPase subunit b